jgi:hypothetical protein
LVVVVVVVAVVVKRLLLATGGKGTEGVVRDENNLLRPEYDLLI